MLESYDKQPTGALTVLSGEVLVETVPPGQPLPE